MTRIYNKPSHATEYEPESEGQKDIVVRHESIANNPLTIVDFPAAGVPLKRKIGPFIIF